MLSTELGRERGKKKELAEENKVCKAKPPVTRYQTRGGGKLCIPGAGEGEKEGGATEKTFISAKVAAGNVRIVIQENET